MAAGIFAVGGSRCQDGLPAIADGTPEPIEDHRAPVGGCTTDSGNGAVRYRPAPVCADLRLVNAQAHGRRWTRADYERAIEGCRP